MCSSGLQIGWLWWKRRQRRAHLFLRSARVHGGGHNKQKHSVCVCVRSTAPWNKYALKVGKITRKVRTCNIFSASACSSLSFCKRRAHLATCSHIRCARADLLRAHTQSSTHAHSLHSTLEIQRRRCAHAGDRRRSDGTRAARRRARGWGCMRRREILVVLVFPFRFGIMQKRQTKAFPTTHSTLWIRPEVCFF